MARILQIQLTSQQMTRTGGEKEQVIMQKISVSVLQVVTMSGVQSISQSHQQVFRSLSLLLQQISLLKVQQLQLQADL